MKKIYLLALLFLVPLALNSQEIPELKSHINDYAGMFSQEAAAEAEKKLSELEKTDSTQIAVLTINSLEGYAIEDYSIKTAEKWKIGQSGKDNGIIIVISKTDRKIRIETGYGLEDRLTDLLAGRIIDNEITPRFKEGKFDEGLNAGIEAVIGAVKGSYKADNSGDAGKPAKGFGIFVGIVLVVMFAGMIRKRYGAVSGAVLFPFLAANTFDMNIILILLIFIPLGFVAGFILSFFRMFTGGGGRGFSGGSGFSGGGFSGGGGRFGGGGASGGW